MPTPKLDVASVSASAAWRRAPWAAVTTAFAVAAAPLPAHAEPVERFPDLGQARSRPVDTKPAVPEAPNGAHAPAHPPVPRARPPSGSQILVERGARHEAAGQLASAITAYTEAVELDRSNGEALLALGRLRAKMSD